MAHRSDWRIHKESLEFYLALSEKLDLYVRQLAYFHAVPNGQTKGSEKARAEILSKDSLEDMPDITGGGHVVSALVDIGLNTANYQEIAAWMQATGVKLDSWSVSTVQRLSCVYQANKIKYQDPKSVRPYIGKSQKAVDAMRAEVMKSLDNLGK